MYFTAIDRKTLGLHYVRPNGSKKKKTRKSSQTFNLNIHDAELQMTATIVQTHEK